MDIFNRPPAEKSPEISKSATDIPKDMTGVDFASNSQKRLERDIAEKEQMRSKAIEDRDYPKLKILNEEISRLKAELSQ